METKSFVYVLTLSKLKGPELIAVYKDQFKAQDYVYQKTGQTMKKDPNHNLWTLNLGGNARVWRIDEVEYHE